MKFIKKTLTLFTLGIMLFSPNFAQRASANSDSIWAEQTILAYIEAKGLDIYPDTDKYNNLLKGIMLGDVPELTKPPSAYIKNDVEGQYVFEYASKNFHTPNAMRSSFGAEIPVAEVSQAIQEKLPITSSSSQTGQNHAISYAYAWATNGGYKRNLAYPDFVQNDCTNFVSQALYAGGFSQIGSGDGCKHEATTTEWFVEYNSSPSWTCIGDDRNWEWATSWSIAADFRTYLIDNGSAVNLGYTYSAATAKYYLSPGDIVQMQHIENGVWTTFHTMLATKEDSNNLYVTYHSGGDANLDYVDKPLSAIQTSSTTQRFLLVQLTYPNFNITFTDVPSSHWAWINIERLYNSGVTAGCATNPLRYCPTSYVTRAQMAVFLLRGIHGSSYSPPNPTGIFSDVPTSHWAARWIEQLYLEGITGGCALSPLRYCPENNTTHAQMAVFLLRSKYGINYSPPSASGSLYSDVPYNHWAASWIEQAANEGIFDNGELLNNGCPSGYFCPETPVTRALMAGLLVRTFNLP